MEGSTEKRILIVDDAPASLKSLANILEKGGFAVTCAATGEEALQLAHSIPFNVVVTDITLPGMSGLNLLKLIKDCKPDIEVIIVTSNASSFTAIKALRLGAYDFIIKPVDDSAILVNIVERAIEKQELTRENRRLINDLQDKNRELNAALQMMRAANRLCSSLSASLDAGQILKKLVESAVEELEAKKGYILLLGREGSAFSMKVSVGVDRELAKNFRLHKSQGIAGLVAANNKLLRIGEDIPTTLTHRMLEEDENGELFTTPGLISAPLLVKDRVVGVITISGRANNIPFTDMEAEFLTTLANHSAIALDNAGAFYKLKKKDT